MLKECQPLPPNLRRSMSIWATRATYQSKEGIYYHTRQQVLKPRYRYDKPNNKLYLKMIHEFHSHFSDNSKQNAATTHTHMLILFDLLKRLGQIRGLQTLIRDNTDGCVKQYCWGTALFLLSLMASIFHNVVIDWAPVGAPVGAPGHGKDVVDGLNTTDKRCYLKQKMSIVCTLEENESNDRMLAFSMVEEKAKSLAEECTWLCLDSSHITGVKSNTKYATLDASAALKVQNL
jgi:hypothetical protein